MKAHPPTSMDKLHLCNSEAFAIETKKQPTARQAGKATKSVVPFPFTLFAAPFGTHNNMGEGEISGTQVGPSGRWKVSSMKHKTHVNEV